MKCINFFFQEIMPKFDTKLWHSFCLFIRKNIPSNKDLLEDDEGLNDLPQFSDENGYWTFINKIHSIVNHMQKNGMTQLNLPILQQNQSLQIDKPLSYITKPDLIQFLLDCENELDYYASKIPDNFIEMDSVECTFDNISYKTVDSLLTIRGILKYKMIFCFVFRTGMRMRDLLILSNNNFIDIVRRKKSIKLYSSFFPHYTPELNKLLYIIAKLNSNQIKLYNYKQIRRFFETGPVALYGWLNYLLFLRGYILPKSLGYHTLRYLFLEMTKVDPYSTNNVEYNVMNNDILKIDESISQILSSAEVYPNVNEN